ncbi:MAG: FliM/FliN family flagellar motor C-terminal domain-containing protein [Terracidiphilus sp.]|jgi:flagellar motor switch protein FliN/FliY
MATTQSLPHPPVAAGNAAPSHPAEAGRAAEVAIEKALVPAPHVPLEGGIVLAGAMVRLPVELDVSIPVREFRVRNLLALEPGQLIETDWAHGEDMPISAGEVQLAWSEFEVVEQQLAVRVTRLF